MSDLRPEEHNAIKLRMADLKARMKKLDHLHKSANIPEWAALAEEREALENQLGDDL